MIVDVESNLAVRCRHHCDSGNGARTNVQSERNPTYYPPLLELRLLTKDNRWTDGYEVGHKLTPVSSACVKTFHDHLFNRPQIDGIITFVYTPRVFGPNNLELARGKMVGCGGSLSFTVQTFTCERGRMRRGFESDEGAYGR